MIFYKYFFPPLSALLFFPTMLLVKRDIRKVQEADEHRALLNEPNSDKES